uniref:Uncharacterized protein n=1 Tax=Anguilla anguilla TaxID=7936 RepID=A0A0E9XCL4_ANGAN
MDSGWHRRIRVWRPVRSGFGLMLEVGMKTKETTELLISLNIWHLRVQESVHNSILSWRLRIWELT